MGLRSIINDFCVQAKNPKNIFTTLKYTGFVSPIAAVFLYAGAPLIGGLTFLAGGMLAAEKWDSVKTIKLKESSKRAHRVLARRTTQVRKNLGFLPDQYDLVVENLKKYISNGENDRFKDIVTRLNPTDVQIGSLMIYAVENDNAAAAYALTQLPNMSTDEFNTAKAIMYVLDNYGGDVRYNLFINNAEAYLNKKTKHLPNIPSMS
jgi:hypothetical protein